MISHGKLHEIGKCHTQRQCAWLVYMYATYSSGRVDMGITPSFPISLQNSQSSSASVAQQTMNIINKKPHPSSSYAEKRSGGLT